MSKAYASKTVPYARKGSTVLARLGVTISYESTIEERLLKVLDMDASVVSATRAETVEVFAADGSSHKYTPDIAVVFGDNRKIVVECKPHVLLPILLRDELAKWEARATLFALREQHLHIVTDNDLSETLVDHAETFGPFHNVPIIETVRKAALNFVREHAALPLSALRSHIKALTDCALSELNSGLNGMIARHELVADTTTMPQDSLIDVFGRDIPAFTAPVGRPLRSILMALPQLTVEDSQNEPILSPERRLESQFLKTKRGERCLKLFSLYSDPTQKLPNKRAEEIGKKVELSARGVFRFRETLIAGGAPGITFTELVPYLTSETSTKPKNIVSPEVWSILEICTNEAYFLPIGTAGRASSINDLYENVRRRCLDEELPPPVYMTVKRHVDAIFDRDPIAATRQRYGKEEADKLEARQGHLNIDRYGQLIAISQCGNRGRQKLQ